MKFKCIRCDKEWGEGDHEDFFSHGLCKGCLKIALTEIYRKRQREGGHFDCFARSTDFCDQLNCCYRNVCLEKDEL